MNGDSFRRSGIFSPRRSITWGMNPTFGSRMPLPSKSRRRLTVRVFVTELRV